MDEPPASPFPPIDQLIAAPGPARVPLLRYGLLAFTILILVSAFTSQSGPEGGQLVDLLSNAALILLFGAMAFMTWLTMQTVRDEQRAVAQVEDMILRRDWAAAGATLSGLLSRPTRAPQTRVLGLILMAKVLVRYHRFADAIGILDHLIGTNLFEGEMLFGLKLERAMAVLKEDRLYDADRAISELRRMPPAGDSAGLALLELYRDVKTGHMAEVMETFHKRLELMRSQFGHRVGDAYGLAARAADALGDDTRALALYRDALVLTPRVELERRYPETAPLAAKFASAVQKAGM